MVLVCVNWLLLMSSKEGTCSYFSLLFLYVDNMASIVSWLQDERLEGIRLRHFKVYLVSLSLPFLFQPFLVEFNWLF